MLGSSWEEEKVKWSGEDPKRERESERKGRRKKSGRFSAQLGCMNLWSIPQ